MAPVMKLAVWNANTGAPLSRARRSTVASRARATPYPARGGMDGERASAGPAGRQTEPLDRGVRIERRESADLCGYLGDQQPPVAGVPAQIEQVGEVACEEVRRDQVGVLAVRGGDYVADRRIIGWNRVAN